MVPKRENRKMMPVRDMWPPEGVYGKDGRKQMCSSVLKVELAAWM